MVSNVSFKGNTDFNRKSNINLPTELAAIGAATLANVGISYYAPKFINDKILDKISLTNEKITPQESKMYKEAFGKAYEKSGIKSKVPVLYVNEKTILFGEDELVKQIKAGRNACFEPIQNKLLLPENKMLPARFHELGHAMNKNLGKVSKFLQKVRIPIVQYGLFGIPALYALCTRKSEPDESGNISKSGKVNNFIRNNAGLIAGAIYMPVVIEEFLASRKGEALAKEFLNPDMLKKVKGVNRWGLATYGVIAKAIALGTWAAVKIVDKVREKGKANIQA